MTQTVSIVLDNPPAINTLMQSFCLKWFDSQLLSQSAQLRSILPGKGLSRQSKNTLNMLKPPNTIAHCTLDKVKIPDKEDDWFERWRWPIYSINMTIPQAWKRTGAALTFSLYGLCDASLLSLNAIPVMMAIKTSKIIMVLISSCSPDGKLI